MKTETGIEASAKERSSQTCEDEGSLDQQSFGRGFDDKKTKEEDRSLDLEEKPQPLLRSLRVPPRIILQSMHDPLGENPSVKFEQSSSKSTPATSKKKNLKTARVKKIAPGSDHRDRATRLAIRPIKFVEDEGKMEGWQLDQMAEMYHWRTLKQCLSSDPVLRILKPKMIGTIQGPISAPTIVSNKLDGINRITQLLNEAGFVAGTFDTRGLLDCEQYRVIHEKVVPLTGLRKSDDHAKETAANDHVVPTAAEVQRVYRTELSQYAPAESELESGDSISTQRMSLGPSGAAHLRDRMENKAYLRSRGEGIESEPRSTPVRAKEDVSSTTQGQLQLYFDAAMERFQQEHHSQDRQAIYPSQRIKVARDHESYTPDIEMESVGSHRWR